MIRREQYMRRIRPFMNTDVVKILTGIRRSGKSVMLKLIQQELKESGVSPVQIISFDFENLRYAKLHTSEALHADILSRIRHLSGKLYFFFDEIQVISGWEKCVNALRCNLDCDIYLSSSCARTLTDALLPYLGNNYVEFVVFPFSFCEYKELYAATLSKIPDAKVFQSYLLLGGMPFLCNLRYEKEPCCQYLKDLFNSIELKDIAQTNNIRDIDLLQRIITFMLSNVGTTFFASSIAKFLKNTKRSASLETILKYISYCCDASLFYQVKREDIRTGKILAIGMKYYLADHGLQRAVYGGCVHGVDLILENIVLIEALRRGYEVTTGKVGSEEIDFICRRSDEKIYIQVSYLLSSQDAAEKEFHIYNEVRDHYPKYVVSMDELDMGRNGILHKNIQDFLLCEW